MLILLGFQYERISFASYAWPHRLDLLGFDFDLIMLLRSCYNALILIVFGLYLDFNWILIEFKYDVNMILVRCYFDFKMYLLVID